MVYVRTYSTQYTYLQNITNIPLTMENKIRILALQLFNITTALAKTMSYKQETKFIYRWYNDPLRKVKKIYQILGTSKSLVRWSDIKTKATVLLNIYSD